MPSLGTALLLLLPLLSQPTRAYSVTQASDVSLDEDTGILFYDTWLYLDETPPPGTRVVTRGEAAVRCAGAPIPFRPTNYRFFLASVSSDDDVFAPRSLALGDVAPRDLTWYVCPATTLEWVPAATLCNASTYRRAAACVAGVWALVSAVAGCDANGVRCTSCVQPAVGCYCDGANPSDSVDLAAASLVVAFLVAERLLFLTLARGRSKPSDTRFRGWWVVAHVCGATAQLLCLATTADFYVRWYAPSRPHQAAAVAMACMACVFCGFHIACHWVAGLRPLVVLREAAVPLGAASFDLATVLLLVAMDAAAPVTVLVTVGYGAAVVALATSYAYDVSSPSWFALRAIDLVACPLFLASYLATTCATRTTVPR